MRTYMINCTVSPKRGLRKQRSSFWLFTCSIFFPVAALSASWSACRLSSPTVAQSHSLWSSCLRPGHGRLEACILLNVGSRFLSPTGQPRLVRQGTHDYENTQMDDNFLFLCFTLYNNIMKMLKAAGVKRRKKNKTTVQIHAILRNPPKTVYWSNVPWRLSTSRWIPL